MIDHAEQKLLTFLFWMFSLAQQFINHMVQNNFPRLAASYIHYMTLQKLQGVMELLEQDAVSVPLSATSERSTRWCFYLIFKYIFFHFLFQVK